MALGRPARGLPRYYMDVGWYRGRRFLGLPVEALFVFEAMVGYSTQHATDGRVPANHEDLAAALGVRVSWVRKAVPALLTDRGAGAPMERDGDDLLLRGWADHNPTAAEVQQYTETKGATGRRGNHVRWHENRNVCDPNCEWCQPPDPEPPPESHDDRNSDPTSDRNSDRKPIANSSHGMGWDGLGSDRTNHSSSSDSRSSDPPATDDDDPGSSNGHVPDEVWTQFAQLRWDGLSFAKRSHIDDESGYRRTIANNARTELAEKAHRWWVGYQGITPQHLAQCLIDDAPPRDLPFTVPDGAAPPEPLGAP